MALNFDTINGTVVIDFDDIGPVTVRPPKYGHWQHLWQARQAAPVKVAERLGGLPDLEEGAETAAVAARANEVQDIRLSEMAALWRLILVGDETFPGLATPAVPDNTDDWPAWLICDVQPDTQPLIDKMFVHWGKAPSVF